jgi:hypothetical protein
MRPVVAVSAILLFSVALCWRLLTSPGQVAINDLGPFGRRMLDTCIYSYDSTSLGRDNPHTIPSYCDFGLLASIAGGALAQHLFLVATFAGAALSMFVLLRRLGNATSVSAAGGMAYAWAPVMLNFQLSGEGLLITAALLPAILAPLIPSDTSSPLGDGARSGALMALCCYANPQAPALAVFLLGPVVAVRMVRREPRDISALLSFLGTFIGVLLLAALPVFQILPGFANMIQSSRKHIRRSLSSVSNRRSSASVRWLLCRAWKGVSRKPWRGRQCN